MQVRGMLAYEKALKLICLLEHPRPGNIGEETYEDMIEELVAAKFRCVVAAQVYGRNKKSSVLKHRWDARSIELLCCRCARNLYIVPNSLKNLVSVPSSQPFKYLAHKSSFFLCG